MVESFCRILLVSLALQAACGAELWVDSRSSFDGATVLLEWKPQEWPADLRGFDVLRSEGDDEPIRISSKRLEPGITFAAARYWGFKKVLARLESGRLSERPGAVLRQHLADGMAPFLAALVDKDPEVGQLLAMAYRDKRPPLARTVRYRVVPIATSGQPHALAPLEFVVETSLKKVAYRPVLSVLRDTRASVMATVEINDEELAASPELTGAEFQLWRHRDDEDAVLVTSRAFGHFKYAAETGLRSVVMRDVHVEYEVIQGHQHRYSVTMTFADPSLIADRSARSVNVALRPKLMRPQNVKIYTSLAGIRLTWSYAHAGGGDRVRIEVIGAGEEPDLLLADVLDAQTADGLYNAVVPLPAGAPGMPFKVRIAIAPEAEQDHGPFSTSVSQVIPYPLPEPPAKLDAFTDESDDGVTGYRIRWQAPAGYGHPLTYEVFSRPQGARKWKLLTATEQVRAFIDTRNHAAGQRLEVSVVAINKTSGRSEYAQPITILPWTDRKPSDPRKISCIKRPHGWEIAWRYDFADQGLKGFRLYQKGVAKPLLDESSLGTTVREVTVPPAIDVERAELFLTAISHFDVESSRRRVYRERTKPPADAEPQAPPWPRLTTVDWSQGQPDVIERTFPGGKPLARIEVLRFEDDVTIFHGLLQSFSESGEVDVRLPYKHGQLHGDARWGRLRGPKGGVGVDGDIVVPFKDGKQSGDMRVTE